MKKCASCTKDLPDAALHCVFCGAKQPPAPAVPHSAAKTAFGYSANDRGDPMRQARRPPTLPPRSTTPGPAMPPPLPGAQVTMPARPQPPIATPAPKAPPLATPILRSNGGPPTAPPFHGAPAKGGLVPASSPSAKTVFAGPAAANARTVMAAPAQGYGSGPAAAMAAAPAPAATGPVRRAITAPPLPSRNGPIIAIPEAQPPPYLASQTASRVIRPVEPWNDRMRVWMILWGLGLIAAFCTPLTTAPLVFPWSTVLESSGTERLPPLLSAAIGVLGLVLAIAPMPGVARGALAASIGLAGICVPIALAPIPAWQDLAPLAGIVLLVPALLVRSEYRDAILPRLLVTLGAAGILLPLVLPQDGTIPLVRVFKDLIDMPGTSKVEPAVTLGAVTLAVVSLLAWLPAPATGAAKLWAWLLILWALFSQVAHVAIGDDPVAAITSTPNATLVAWIAGSPSVLGSAYLALVGYGMASVIGKQLE